MKMYVIVLVLLQACVNNVERPTGGTYVSHFEHEYASNDDTLRVTKIAGSDGTFELKRTTGTTSIRNGQKQPKKSASETMTGIFDAKTRVINEVKSGRTFVWDARNETLKWGDQVYSKIGIE